MSFEFIKDKVWPKREESRHIEQARVRALYSFCYLAGFFGLITSLFNVMYHWEGYALQSVAGIVGAALHLLFPVIFSMSSDKELALTCIVSCSGGMLMILLLLSGGIVSSPTLFLQPYVLTSALLLGWRVGGLLTCLVILIYSCAYFFQSELSALVGSTGVAETYSRSIYIAASLVALFLYIGGAAFRYEMEFAADHLRKQRVAAEQASLAKSEFLATMSHEIRTPMNGVLGMAQLLQQTELTPKQAQFTNTILDSGNSLLAIINDILDFSKIEAGSLRLERNPFDIREVSIEVFRLLGPSAEEKGISVNLDLHEEVYPMVWGDELRFRQILINLVSNAIKFTNKGSVSVGIAPCEEHGHDCTKFVVEDTGVGIPKDRLGDIFLKFEQAEKTTTREFGGTGLGLAIVKQLVDAMGGHIGVESKVGVGTKIWCELRLLEVKVPPEEAIS